MLGHGRLVARSQRLQSTAPTGRRRRWRLFDCVVALRASANRRATAPRHASTDKKHGRQSRGIPDKDVAGQVGHVIDGKTAVQFSYFARRGDEGIDAHVSVAPSAPALQASRRAKFLQPGGHLKAHFHLNRVLRAERVSSLPPHNEAADGEEQRDQVIAAEHEHRHASCSAGTQDTIQNTVGSSSLIDWLEHVLVRVNCLRTNHEGTVSELRNPEWLGHMRKRHQQPMEYYGINRRSETKNDLEHLYSQSRAVTPVKLRNNDCGFLKHLKSSSTLFIAAMQVRHIPRKQARLQRSMAYVQFSFGYWPRVFVGDSFSPDWANHNKVTPILNVRDSWADTYNVEVLRADEGEAGENPPTSGIVRHNSHLRKSGVNRPGIESGSHWWEASSLTAQPPSVEKAWRHIYEAVNEETTLAPQATAQLATGKKALQPITGCPRRLRRRQVPVTLCGDLALFQGHDSRGLIGGERGRGCPSRYALTQGPDHATVFINPGGQGVVMPAANHCGESRRPSYRDVLTQLYSGVWQTVANSSWRMDHIAFIEHEAHISLDVMIKLAQNEHGCRTERNSTWSQYQKLLHLFAKIGCPCQQRTRVLVILLFLSLTAVYKTCFLSTYPGFANFGDEAPGPVKYENAFSSRQQPMVRDKLPLVAYGIEVYRVLIVLKSTVYLWVTRKLMNMDEFCDVLREENKTEPVAKWCWSIIHAAQLADEMFSNLDHARGDKSRERVAARGSGSWLLFRLVIAHCGMSPIGRSAVVQTGLRAPIGCRHSPIMLAGEEAIAEVGGCCPTPGSYRLRKVFSCEFAIGSEACSAGLINCDPIAKDKIDVNHLYTEVDIAIGSQFSRHDLDDSEPIADLRGSSQWTNS
ncbi:hypothetical protein PR048_025699 [Dryococelus australis]|uniref:Uncharacterized protein n=1 Tax=Dryococelus australis TaxID=614101 RepID=A0ABQ9GJ97_9NEOP|nr:hypothetical protein PR048_025699 [Dryococelus australis]